MTDQTKPPALGTMPASWLQLETSVYRASACIHMLTDLLSRHMEEHELAGENSDPVACGIIELGHQSVLALNTAFQATTTEVTYPKAS